MRLLPLWLIGFLSFTGLFAAYANAAPAFEEKTLARVIRTERRFPIDFDACKSDLFGSGSSQGDLHSSWSCTFGRMYWVLPYSVQSWGVRKSFAVDHAPIAPGCEISLDFATNGFGVFVELDHLGSKAEAAACIDLAVHTPGTGIASPAIQVYDTFEGTPLPGPEFPADPILYDDHVIGAVATEFEFAYHPTFEDFESRMVFHSKTMSGCKPGIGCISISEGKSTFTVSGGPEAEDFGFGSDGFNTADGPGCQDAFSFDSGSRELSWTEAFVAYSPILPPFTPGKGKIRGCAKATVLIPRLRVFRYDPPYQPLSR